MNSLTGKERREIGIPNSAEWATWGAVMGNTIIYQRSDGSVVRTSQCEVHSWFDCECERTRTRRTIGVGVVCGDVCDDAALYAVARLSAALRWFS